VGTIADLVPLTGENRILAQHGLARLNRTENRGLRALCSVAGITDEIDAYHVGFLIGPRLNAAGRLGDALVALELLLTADDQRARQLAAQLDATNRQRQQVELETFEQAVEQIGDSVDPKVSGGIVVAGAAWHVGVVGIVASRLCARYHRPVAVIALDGTGSGRGSCRSVEGFDMVRGLGECADLLTAYGGHAMAAGLEIEERRLEAFRRRFSEVIAAHIGADQLKPVQRVDGWVTLEEADEALREAQDRLRPFGVGNVTPVWAISGARVEGPPREVGKGHLKMRLVQGATAREAIGFGMAGRTLPAGPLDVAFTLKLNHYQGRRILQLHLQDFRATPG
jgi:single-stranded-DNA-specific exonuclease